MTRFLFAVPVLALSAAVGFADTPASGPVTAAPAVGPVVAPTYSAAPTTTARRGLFGRLRNRNTATYSSAPLMSAPAPVVTPAPTPAPAPAPTPMPGVKPAGAMMPMTAVVPAGGSVPPGTYTATDGTVIQVGGMQTQPQSTRRGLFSRLRNR
jgi:hypothetical protein